MGLSNKDVWRMIRDYNYDPREQPQLSILAFIRDPRCDPTAICKNFCKTLEAAGHKVRYMDPLTVLSRQQEYMYVEHKKPFPLESLYEILKFYDLVIYNNFPLQIDARNCPIPTVMLYDEDWKGTQIFDGTDYVITQPQSLQMLNHLSHYTFCQLKGAVVGNLPGIDWRIWKSQEKTIPLAYPGAIRSQCEKNYLFAPFYRMKRDYCQWAEKEFGLKYWVPPPPITQYVEDLSHVDVAMHFSDYHSVGQGAYEDMACGCVVFETPNSEAAAKAGLIDGFNCFLFDSKEEFTRKYNALTPAIKDEVRKNGMELAQKYKWDKVYMPFMEYMPRMARREQFMVNLNERRTQECCPLSAVFSPFE